MGQKSKKAAQNCVDAASNSTQNSNSNGTNSRTTRSTSALARGTPTTAPPAGQPETTRASNIVKIRLRPELLARFPAGKSTAVADPPTEPLYATPRGAVPAKKVEHSKVFQQGTYASGSKQKHAPVGPRGTVILLKDNPNLDRKPVHKGNPEPHKLTLTFKDSKSNIHKRVFPEKAANKWDDAKWIKDVNKWRGQAIRRSFRHDPTFRGQPARTKYSVREMNSLKAELRSRMEKTGQRLSRNEWRAVAKLHNERYSGTKVFAGEKLENGGVSKSTQTVERRSPIAIQGLFERLPYLRSFVDALVEEYAGQNALIEGGAAIKNENMDDEMDLDSDLDVDYSSSDEDSGNESNGGRDGGELDLRLEDSSEDEEDGMRPASTQNGARLLETCG